MKILTAMGATFLVTFLLLGLLSSWTHGVIGGIISAAILGVLLSSRRDASDREESAETGAAPEPVREVSVAEANRQRLQDLNLTLREDPHRNEEVVRRFEAIMDLILRVLGRLNSEHGGSELTFTVNRSTTTYLPTLLGSYLRLQPGAREGRTAEVLEALTSIETRITNIVTAVESGDLSKFDVEATFLGKIIGGDSVSA